MSRSNRNVIGNFSPDFSPRGTDRLTVAGRLSCQTPTHLAGTIILNVIVGLASWGLWPCSWAQGPRTALLLTRKSR